PKLKAAGVKVIPVVPSVKLANRIEQSGADAMIVEGMEAGGHIGNQTTMALMSNVLATPHAIPVIVAGGISDGRAIAAALIMGADGVQMGSRFILTEECPTHPKTKEAILKAVDTDSAVTGFSRGHAARCLKNEFTSEFLKLETAGAPQEDLDKLSTGTNRLGSVEGDIVKGAVMVGQSLNVLNEILPCAELMERLVNETKETLAKAQKIEI
ncbi:MAG TPA: nitronate monooxygenase, partial [Candidatus Avacidaminococcus intestinavium]|nr:nitronate monooxygenase [Candidatus Avacidaminococcus intestinavium]